MAHDSGSSHIVMDTSNGRVLYSSGQILKVLTEPDTHNVEAQKHGPRGRIEVPVQIGAHLSRQQIDFGFDPRLVGPQRWISRRFFRSVTSIPTLEEHLPSDNPRSHTSVAYDGHQHLGCD